MPGSGRIGLYQERFTPRHRCLGGPRRIPTRFPDAGRLGGPIFASNHHLPGTGLSGREQNDTDGEGPDGLML